MWVEEVSSWPPDDEKWMHHLEKTPDGPRLARTEYIIGFHDKLRDFLTKGHVPAAAGTLLGEPAVLYKEKINYKYPGGGGYAPHQDAPAYRFVKNHITCSIAIDESTPENGCLYFAAGKHRDGLLAMNDEWCIDEAVADMLDWQPVVMQPGDALFFSSYAPHKSPLNNSDKPRRSLYLTYNAAAEGDLREEYYAEKRREFAVQTPGDKVKISLVGHFQGQPVENA